MIIEMPFQYENTTCGKYKCDFF